MVTKFYDFLKHRGFVKITNSLIHIYGYIVVVLCVRESFSVAVCPQVTGNLMVITFAIKLPFKESCIGKCHTNIFQISGQTSYIQI